MNIIKKNKILYISSYPPRICGIANFTKDLIKSLDLFFGNILSSQVIALNETRNGSYIYNSKVNKVLVSKDLKEYKKLAEYINNQDDVLAIMIEHEFGLFGGENGKYLLEFLKRVEKKVFVTLHTVLSHPHKKIKNVLFKIAHYSTALIVMNEISKSHLQKFYNIEAEKINLVFHGVPQVEFVFSKHEKRKNNIFKNKIVLLTFGLLSPNKGVEYTIKALPEIIKKYPNLVFLLVGKTHPGVINQEGEKYRNYLKRIIKKLNLEENVIFYNKYCSLKKLISYLQISDVYISSSLDPHQSVSGTISYALGMGRPVISTENEYAKFILNKENGFLVPFKNSQAITGSLLKLLEDKELLRKKSFFAYRDSRKMIWPNVARSYFNLYQKYFLLDNNYSLPKIKLDYIKRLTDSFGMLQFANFTEPDKKSGYTLDDNCRALLLCSKYFLNNPQKEIRKLMNIYLNFIEYINKDNDFFNIVTVQKKLKEKNREDSLGRLLMSLGYILNQKSLPKNILKRSFELWKKNLNHIDGLQSPRAIAFSIIGLSYFLENKRDMNLEKKIIKLSEKLYCLYKKCSTDKWKWFENILSYSNAILPQALLRAYKITKNKFFFRIAEESLKFLLKKSFQKKVFSPIGQKGWFSKNSKLNSFDQQPEEVATLILCLIDFYLVSSKKKYKDYAFKIFEWFLGNNYLQQMLYDVNTGGCYDGLGKYSLNFNQGAESSVMYLLARLEMEKIEYLEPVLS